MCKHISKIIHIILLPLCLNAIEFNYEKINEFAIGGNYDGDGKIIVEFPYMYAASRYGLEIYEIDTDNNVELINRLPLFDDTRVLHIKNNIAYVISVSFFENHYRLYKIDISNILEPVILDSIYFEDEVCLTIGDIYNDYLIFVCECNDEYYNFYYKIYKIPELEFIQNYPINGAWFIQINDSLAIKYEYSNTYTLYDFSDPENISEITQIYLETGGIPGLDNIQTINDSIVAGIAEEGVVFWNYSDVTNWEYIYLIFIHRLMNIGVKIFVLLRKITLFFHT